jgi:hypothetical protein
MVKIEESEQYKKCVIRGVAWKKPLSKATAFAATLEAVYPANELSHSR